MDKVQTANSSIQASAPPMPSAPLPTAPPSYEEAVGLMSSRGPTSEMTYVQPNAPGAPPYPVAGTPMPMPTSTHTIGITQMPAAMQQNVPNQPTVEVRVVRPTVAVSLGSHPVKMSCPTCHMDIKTTTMSDHQPSAHVCCIIMCLLGCCLCSCLPYCMSAFMSVNHFCPNCKAYIGTWKG